MKKFIVSTMLIIAVMLFLFLTGCSNNVESNIPVENEKSMEDIDKEESKEGTNEEAGVSEYGIRINENHILYTDETGEEVTIKKNPQNVIVLNNSYMEMWY